jgi:hypothetical protein
VDSLALEATGPTQPPGKNRRGKSTQRFLRIVVLLVK